MRIETQRFGTISLDQDQLFLFPAGLIGMESLRDWALLPDLENEAVAWLQSASRGDRALPLISPRAFFPDYRIQVSRRELTSLHLKPGSETYVLTTISGHSGKLTTNLRSPIVLNLSRRLGCQIITDNEYPLQQPVNSFAGASNVVRELVAPRAAAKQTDAAIVATGNPVPAFTKNAAGLFASTKKSAA
ncbi:flagellar assembly protein FliW [Rhodopirellula sp. MGV]|nr:flagellar assembly protein FliW [Rhodopirellula sp. MGV]PNY36175.1 flagellar assembly protein FliW [Rhodopirellula baltica]